MARNLLPRTVAALLVLSALGGLALPARAALVYSDCVSYLGQAMAPPGGAAGAAPPRGPACLDGNEVGDPAARGSPPGEYLDLATGIVYRQAGPQYVPVGLGVPQGGYVELTAESWAGNSYCSSTNPLMCPDPIVTQTPCDAQLCESLHVAVTGCHDVQVQLDFGPLGSAATGERYETHDYPPQGCVADADVYLPAMERGPLVPGAGFFGPVTLITDAFNDVPSCWLSGTHILPQSVTSTVLVGGRAFPPIVNRIC